MAGVTQVLEHSGLREGGGFLGDRLKLGEVQEEQGGQGGLYVRDSGVLVHRYRDNGVGVRQGWLNVSVNA